MPKLRANPTPTKSTVEAVEVLNGSAKGIGRSFLRSRDGKPPASPDVEQSPDNAPKSLPRASPNKRKEQPTKEAGPNKLRRLSKPASENTNNTASMSPHSSNIRLVKGGKLSGIYDPLAGNDEGRVEQAAALQPKKKQTSLRRPPPRSPFKGAPVIGLPDSETVISSSPAQATRSHDSARSRAIAQPHQSGAGPSGQSKKGQKNILAQAAKLAADADKLEAQHSEASPRPRRGRSSKAAENEPMQSAVTESPAGDTSDHVEVREEEAVDDVQSDAALISNKRRKIRAKFDIDDKEVGNAIANVEEAISVHGCDAAWRKVLVYAKKMLRPANAAEPKQIKEVMEAVKNMKSAYRQIVQRAEAGASADEVQEVEAEIMIRTEQLENLRVAIAAADPKVRDIAFLEQIYEQILPRMSLMLKDVLYTRYWKDRDNLSVDSLEELVAIINITLDYWSIVESAKKRPQAIENEEGEPIKGIALQLVANLKIVKRNYNNFIDDHYVRLAKNAEARKREELTEREARVARAAQEARLQQNAEAYQRKLQRDFEERQKASRELAEKVAGEEKRWKTKLMSATSLEAERLRNKFGLPFRAQGDLRPWPTLRDTFVAIDDFEVDSNFVPVNAQITQPPSHGIHRARPRPRRELTEDIPAPVIEPIWTDQQIEALVWGLRIFHGSDRYQNILRAPEIKDLLEGKNDFDLMQQALYIKESMARAMDTGVLPDGTPLEDDWSWLRSV